MKKNGLYLLALISFTTMVSCHSSNKEEEAPEGREQTVTPVTVTSLSTEPMTDYIELNATSAFLRSAIIKASANGYVVSVNAHVRRPISANQVAFVLRTKESHTLGNTINLLDSTFKFSGTINISAGTSGYVSAVSHQAGDYVQEGEQLATINDV